MNEEIKRNDRFRDSLNLNVLQYLQILLSYNSHYTL